MSVTPVGNTMMMKGQKVRGVFSTNLSPLLKLAIAPMPPQPKKRVETEEVDLGRNDPQSQPQSEQGGVGGDFTRPGSLQNDPNSKQTQMGSQGRDQGQTPEQQAAEHQQNRAKVKDLSRTLVQRLRQKQINKASITTKNSPESMTITLDTSHRITVNGQIHPAQDALQDVMDWAFDNDITVSVKDYMATAGREIEKVNPEQRTIFTFTYSPKASSAVHKGFPEITEMGSRPPEKANSRMGNVPSQEVVARTLPEMLAMNKQALIQRLCKYIPATAGEK